MKRVPHPIVQLMSCCRNLGLALLVVWVVQLFSSEAGAQQLLHRYSFTSSAADSVGNAYGVPMSSGDPVSFSNGAIVLPGIKSCYVDLPNDLVANLTNHTIE